MLSRETVPSEEEFKDLVRGALLHLYDVTYLQTHPLARFVDLPAGSISADRGSLLLRELVDAVESLRPQPSARLDQRSSRNYRLLELRYLEGASFANVMASLGVSKTQYQRDHARALGAVASILAQRWHLDLGGTALRDASSPGSLALTEADKVVNQSAQGPVDLAELVSGLVELLRPSAASAGTELSFASTAAAPLTCADRLAARQVLFGLLNTALQIAAPGSVRLTLAARDGVAEILVQATSGPGMGGRGGPIVVDPVELEVVHHFVEALKGEILIDGRGSIWSAKLLVPVTERPTLLVVDNHPDFAGLVSRYLVDDEWEVVGAQDVQSAQRQIQQHAPAAILMDVLMPGQDGWDLLASLKASPATRPVPVIICSVLHEPRIAHALGADDYLAKPVSPNDLRAALTRLRRRTIAEEPERSSRLR
jgi:CheY-like chemotaxis protein